MRATGRRWWASRGTLHSYRPNSPAIHLCSLSNHWSRIHSYRHPDNWPMHTRSHRKRCRLANYCKSRVHPSLPGRHQCHRSYNRHIVPNSATRHSPSDNPCNWQWVPHPIVGYCWQCCRSESREREREIETISLEDIGWLSTHIHCDSPASDGALCGRR